MSTKSPALLIALIGTFAALDRVSAQSPQAAQANEAAYATFSTGNYKDAATAYQALIQNYPTDLIIPSAMFQLAYCDYFLANFSEAEDMLGKAVASPAASPDLRQLADGLLPQVLSTEAASLAPNSDEQRAAYQKAIAKFTDYITKHPTAPDIENAVYGRALANFQIRSYAEAITDLESNVQKYATSPTVATSRNLLALAYATQGVDAINKGDSAHGFELLNKAADLNRGIISQKTDVALINEAYFQLGQILFTEAQFSPDAQKQGYYADALEAYRSIAPKEAIIALEQQKIASFPELKGQALRARNAPLLKQLNKDNERELRKLAELNSRPDDTAVALEKMGEIYFNAQKPGETDFNTEKLDQARVVMTHVQPFLTGKDAQKRAQYFVAMTYALQGITDKAVDAYNQFTAKYKGEAIAENLPFALGNMFLAAGKPTEAVTYFDESLNAYPNGRLAALSAVSKAQAQVKLGQADEAMKTFQTFLAGNPSPDVAAVAQSGVAGIYKDKRQWDDAITAYKVVTDKYPTAPQAVEAQYWIAVCTAQKGDNAGAVPLLQAFITANPGTPFTPMAMYALGSTQITLKNTADGMTTLASLADKFPDSPPAPFTYLVRAQLDVAAGKLDDASTLIHQFIDRYPKSDKISYAYEFLAQAATNAGKPDEAVAAFQDFVQKFPNDPHAPSELCKVAEIQRGQADALGRYTALTPDEQAAWKKAITASIATCEQVIKQYPTSPSAATAFNTLLSAQSMQADAGIKDAPAVEKYFQDLSDSATDPSVKSNALFTLATFVGDKDKARAFKILSDAYNPQVVYAPQSLDLYGLALIDNGKLDEAEQVFEKVDHDYPLPAGVPAAQVGAAVQEAQAIALFGKGRVAQEKKQTAEAGQYFQMLKQLYPWSPKVLEANYGIAQSLREQGKADDAVALLGGIIRTPTATAELRAKSMLLGGYLMVDKMNAATDPKEKNQYLGAAIDYFMKIAQFYAGVPSAAATGLWEGAQLQEQQANASTDPAFKTQQLGRARQAYQQIVTDYSTSEYAAKAKDRLAALGPAK